jgi:predicted phosphoribosyltransferase
MFRNREDAAGQLADRLQQREWRNPLVLGIPRGGVVVGAMLARRLGADLDVVLARKLRAPNQPEAAVGAIAESGAIRLNRHFADEVDATEGYLIEEGRQQLAEIRRRALLFRAVRPAAPITGRSVIVTDDGIATGSTMQAALTALRAEQPYEVVVAIPVASPDRLAEVGRECDAVVCLLAPADFWAVGQYYEDFAQVDDEQVLDLLRAVAPSGPARPQPTAVG